MIDRKAVEMLLEFDETMNHIVEGGNVIDAELMCVEDDGYTGRCYALEYRNKDITFIVSEEERKLVFAYLKESGESGSGIVNELNYYLLVDYITV